MLLDFWLWTTSSVLLRVRGLRPDHSRPWWLIGTIFEICSFLPLRPAETYHEELAELGFLELWIWMILVIRDGSYNMVQLQREEGTYLKKSVHLNQPLYAFVFYLPFSDVNVQISKAAQRSGWWGCLLRSFGRPNVRMVWKGHLKDVWEMSIDEIQSIDIWWNKILKYGRWKKVLLQRTLPHVFWF